MHVVLTLSRELWGRLHLGQIPVGPLPGAVPVTLSLTPFLFSNIVPLTTVHHIDIVALKCPVGILNLTSIQIFSWNWWLVLYCIKSIVWEWVDTWPSAWPKRGKEEPTSSAQGDLEAGQTGRPPPGFQVAMLPRCHVAGLQVARIKASALLSVARLASSAPGWALLLG